MEHTWSYVPLVLVLLTSSCALADYNCLCNYDVKHRVLSQPRDNAPVLGYLYEFDCKEVVSTFNGTDGWYSFAFEHNIGYVQKGSNNLQEVTCQGQPPLSDRVSTGAPTPTSTRKSTQPATTSSSSTQRLTDSVTTKVPFTTSASSTTVSTTASAATTSTVSATARTATTASITSTQRVTSLRTSRVPLTTSAASPSTTTTKTTTPSRLTIHGSQTTQQHIIKGNTSLCPAQLHQYAREDGATLTQYGNSCYELVSIRAIWAKAENDCRAKGGHLFHVQSADFQTFIYNWIKSYQFDHAVWTGLQDLINEEYFEWVTGDHLIYTNWYPDRYGNLASHHLENCVLLVPYAPYYGQWDDVQCGLTTMFGDSGQQNPFICEYRIDGSHFKPSSILVG